MHLYVRHVTDSNSGAIASAGGCIFDVNHYFLYNMLLKVFLKNKFLYYRAAPIGRYSE